MYLPNFIFSLSQDICDISTTALTRLRGMMSGKFVSYRSGFLVCCLLDLIFQFLNHGEVKTVPQITARSSSRVVQPQSSTLPTLLPLHSSKSPAWWLFGHARQSFNACSHHAPSLVGSPAKRLKARNHKPLPPVIPWSGHRYRSFSVLIAARNVAKRSLFTMTSR